MRSNGYDSPMTYATGKRNAQWIARLTPAIRAKIRKSREPAMAVAARYRIHVATVYRLRR